MSPRLAAAAAAVLVLTAPPARASGEGTLDTLNRAVHAFNAALHETVVVPAGRGYEAWVPPEVRQGFANVLANLREPLTAVASGARGDFANAGTALGRFAVNTTLGLGGVHDRAAAFGWHSRPQDLGDALCAHGVPEGAFLVLPFYGPTTLRDLAGLTAVAATGVAAVGEDWLVGALADHAVRALDTAAEAAGFAVWAVDPYAQQKSAYLQYRRAACGNGDPPAAPEMPEFGDSGGDTGGGPAGRAAAPDAGTPLLPPVPAGPAFRSAALPSR